MTEAEWLVCAGPAPMLEFLWNKTGARKLRLFAIACRRCIRYLMRDGNYERCEVVERFADGQCSTSQLGSASVLSTRLTSCAIIRELAGQIQTAFTSIYALKTEEPFFPHGRWTKHEIMQIVRILPPNTTLCPSGRRELRLRNQNPTFDTRYDLGRSSMPDEKTEEANIIPYGNLPIDDVACCDCGGVVTCFMVPDSVWDGLGFALGDFACIACVGQRLNPALNAEGIRKNPRYWLEKEIWRQRKRFKLVEGQKSFQSMKVQIPGVFVLVGGEGVTSVPKEVSISRGEREVASPLPETADGAPVRKDDRDERPSVRQGKGPSERNSFVRSGSGSEEGDQAAR